MHDIDDMKRCIQEWFSEVLNPVEVARTYKEITLEAEKQLDFMMEQRIES